MEEQNSTNQTQAKPSPIKLRLRPVEPTPERVFHAEYLQEDPAPSSSLPSSISQECAEKVKEDLTAMKEKFFCLTKKVQGNSVFQKAEEKVKKTISLTNDQMINAKEKITDFAKEKATSFKDSEKGHLAEDLKNKIAEKAKSMTQAFSEKTDEIKNSQFYTDLKQTAQEKIHVVRKATQAGKEVIALKLPQDEFKESTSIPSDSGMADGIMAQEPPREEKAPNQTMPDETTIAMPPAPPIPPKKRHGKLKFFFFLILLVAIALASVFLLGKMYCNKGKQLWQQEQFQEAAIRFKKSASLFNIEGRYYFALSIYHGHIADIPLETARKNMEFSADFGNVQAQWWMGNFALNGIGMPQDHEKAIRWFGTAASHDYPPAFVDLAKCYLYGYGTGIDVQSGLSWLRKALSVEEPSAYWLTGTLFENGLANYTIDQEKALYWYRSGDLHDDPMSKFSFVKLQLAHGTVFEREDALKKLRILSSQNIPEAMAFRAIYDNDISASQRTELLEKAWEMGYFDAYAFYSICDLPRGLEKLLLAAKKNSPLAQFLIAEIMRISIENGKGIKHYEVTEQFPIPNFKNMMDYYKKASDTGFLPAQLAYARYTLEGKTSGAEKTKEMAWLEQLADAGNSKAQFLVARFSDKHNANMIQDNPQLSLENYNKVVNVPSTLPSLLHYDGTSRQLYEILTSSAINIEDKLEACHRLSVIYKEGYGTQQDMDLSIKYLCEGINLFYDFSMFQPNNQNQAVNVKDFQENEFYFKLIKDFTLQCDLLNTVPIFATHACSAFETIKTFTDRIPREEKDDILGKAWYMQGYCHAKGIGGVPQNQVRALDCFTKAAELKNPKGLYVCGLFAERGYVQNGNPHKPNLPRAKQLYREAASLGNEKAQFALNRLEKENF